MSAATGRYRYDAIVIGAGPNGLAAALTLGQNGFAVLVVEAAERPGGGLRSAELTLPGFRHDVCSSVYPLVPESPFFREFFRSGAPVELVRPGIALAHAYTPNQAVAVYEDLDRTANELGTDGDTYRQRLLPFLGNSRAIFDNILERSLCPERPAAMLRFAAAGRRSAAGLACRWFRNDETRGMFAGMAAHATLPLDRILTGGVGLMFCIAAHSNGWPVVRGGAQRLTDALCRQIESHGGEFLAGFAVKRLDELPSARAVLFDTTPSQLIDIAGADLPARYARALSRYRHGPGLFKTDWALSGPIPWSAPACRSAGTVHVGGGLDAVSSSELLAWNGQISAEPFLIVTQPSVCDPERAPAGRHTAWAYCHVPHGSLTDLTAAIESRIEAFAPGFRETILARHAMNTGDLARYNANYIGGDISGGVMDWRQMLARPVLSRDPWSTPNPRLFICSSSTPPGPGVHGMCGQLAARSAIKYLRQSRQKIAGLREH